MIWCDLIFVVDSEIRWSGKWLDLSSYFQMIMFYTWFATWKYFTNYLKLLLNISMIVYKWLSSKMDQAWSYKGFGFEIWIVMLWNDIDNEKCFKVLRRLYIEPVHQGNILMVIGPVHQGNILMVIEPKHQGNILMVIGPVHQGNIPMMIGPVHQGNIPMVIGPVPQRVKLMVRLRI